MKERRSCKRFDVAVNIKYKILNWNKEYKTESINLSRSGMCLMLSEKLKDGTPIELEIPPLDARYDRPLKIKAITVWTRQLDEKGRIVSEEPTLESYFGITFEPKESHFMTGIKFLEEIDYGLLGRILEYYPTATRIK